MEPMSRVHQLGVAAAEKFLELHQLTALDKTFQIAVSDQQTSRCGGLVELPALDAKQAVFNDVASADAMHSSQMIQLSDQRQEFNRLAVYLRWQAGFQADGYDCRLV